MHEANIVGELRDVMRCTMEVDLPYMSDVVGVSWVVPDISLRSLRLNSGQRVWDWDFLWCRVPKVFLQG